ncbi:MAG: hypothetical protein ACODAA_05820 [Gemmatimonadota bacterium]
MESPPVPSSLVGTIVFFALLAMIAWLLVRETLRIVLKPALLLAGVVLIAVWAGWLDGTAVERWMSWLGDRLVGGLAEIAEWASAAYERTAATGPDG